MYAIVFKNQFGVEGSGLAAAAAKVAEINALLGSNWTQTFPHPRNVDDMTTGTVALAQGPRWCVRTTAEINAQIGIAPGGYAHTLDEGTPGADADGVPYDWGF